MQSEFFTRCFETALETDGRTRLLKVYQKANEPTVPTLCLIESLRRDYEDEDGLIMVSSNENEKGFKAKHEMSVIWVVGWSVGP